MENQRYFYSRGYHHQGGYHQNQCMPPFIQQQHWGYRGNRQPTHFNHDYNNRWQGRRSYRFESWNNNHLDDIYMPNDEHSSIPREQRHLEYERLMSAPSSTKKNSRPFRGGPSRWSPHPPQQRRDHQRYTNNKTILPDIKIDDTPLTDTPEKITETQEEVEGCDIVDMDIDEYVVVSEAEDDDHETNSQAETVVLETTKIEDEDHKEITLETSEHKEKTPEIPEEKKEETKKVDDIGEIFLKKMKDIPNTPAVKRSQKRERSPDLTEFSPENLDTTKSYLIRRKSICKTPKKSPPDESSASICNSLTPNVPPPIVADNPLVEDETTKETSSLAPELVRSLREKVENQKRKEPVDLDNSLEQYLMEMELDKSPVRKSPPEDLDDIIRRSPPQDGLTPSKELEIQLPKDHKKSKHAKIKRRRKSTCEKSVKPPSRRGSGDVMKEDLKIAKKVPLANREGKSEDAKLKKSLDKAKPLKKTEEKPTIKENGKLRLQKSSNPPKNNEGRKSIASTTKKGKTKDSPIEDKSKSSKSEELFSAKVSPPLEKTSSTKPSYFLPIEKPRPAIEKKSHPLLEERKTNKTPSPTDKSAPAAETKAQSVWEERKTNKTPSPTDKSAPAVEKNSQSVWEERKTNKTPSIADKSAPSQKKPQSALEERKTNKTPSAADKSAPPVEKKSHSSLEERKRSKTRSALENPGIEMKSHASLEESKKIWSGSGKLTDYKIPKTTKKQRKEMSRADIRMLNSALEDLNVEELDGMIPEESTAEDDEVAIILSTPKPARRLRSKSLNHLKRDDAAPQRTGRTIERRPKSSRSCRAKSADSSTIPSDIIHTDFRVTRSMSRILGLIEGLNTATRSDTYQDVVYNSVPIDDIRDSESIEEFIRDSEATEELVCDSEPIQALIHNSIQDSNTKEATLEDLLNEAQKSVSNRMEFTEVVPYTPPMEIDFSREIPTVIYKELDPNDPRRNYKKMVSLENFGKQAKVAKRRQSRVEDVDGSRKKIPRKRKDDDPDYIPPVNLEVPSRSTAIEAMSEPPHEVSRTPSKRTPERCPSEETPSKRKTPNRRGNRNISIDVAMEMMSGSSAGETMTLNVSHTINNAVQSCEVFRSECNLTKPLNVHKPHIATATSSLVKRLHHAQVNTTTSSVPEVVRRNPVDLEELSEELFQCFAMSNILVEASSKTMGDEHIMRITRDYNKTVMETMVRFCEKMAKKDVCNDFKRFFKQLHGKMGRIETCSPVDLLKPNADFAKYLEDVDGLCRNKSEELTGVQTPPSSASSSSSDDVICMEIDEGRHTPTTTLPSISTKTTPDTHQSPGHQAFNDTILSSLLTITTTNVTPATSTSLPTPVLCGQLNNKSSGVQLPSRVPTWNEIGSPLLATPVASRPEPPTAVPQMPRRASLTTTMSSVSVTPLTSGQRACGMPSMAPPVQHGSDVQRPIYTQTSNTINHKIPQQQKPMERTNPAYSMMQTTTNNIPQNYMTASQRTRFLSQVKHYRDLMSVYHRSCQEARQNLQRNKAIAPQRLSAVSVLTPSRINASIPVVSTPGIVPAKSWNVPVENNTTDKSPENGTIAINTLAKLINHLESLPENRKDGNRKKVKTNNPKRPRKSKSSSSADAQSTTSLQNSSNTSTQRRSSLQTPMEGTPCQNTEACTSHNVGNSLLSTANIQQLMEYLQQPRNRQYFEQMCASARGTDTTQNVQNQVGYPQRTTVLQTPQNQNGGPGASAIQRNGVVGSGADGTTTVQNVQDVNGSATRTRQNVENVNSAQTRTPVLQSLMDTRIIRAKIVDATTNNLQNVDRATSVLQNVRLPQDLQNTNVAALQNVELPTLVRRTPVLQNVANANEAARKTPLLQNVDNLVGVIRQTGTLQRTASLQNGDTRTSPQLQNAEKCAGTLQIATSLQNRDLGTPPTLQNVEKRAGPDVMPNPTLRPENMEKSLEGQRFVTVNEDVVTQTLQNDEASTPTQSTIPNTPQSPESTSSESVPPLPDNSSLVVLSPYSNISSVECFPDESQVSNERTVTPPPNVDISKVNLASPTQPDEPVNIDEFLFAKVDEEEAEVHSRADGPQLEFVDAEEYIQQNMLPEDPVPRNESVDSGVGSPTHFQVDGVDAEDQVTCEICPNLPLFICSCQSVTYCSVTCQSTDWDSHRDLHGTIQRTVV